MYKNSIKKHLNGIKNITKENDIKKLKFLPFALMLLVTLTGYMRNTTSGGDESLTNNVSIFTYSLSKQTQSEVDDAKETIVITEMLSDSTLSTSESVATKTTNFIHSVKDKMEGLGYKLISTDTNGVGEQGYKIFITLIFKRK